MRKTGLALIALAGAIGIVRLRARQLAPVDVAPLGAMSVTSLAAPTPIVPIAKSSAKPGAASEPRAARAEDLERFHELAAKVFVTDAEKRDLDRLLHDSSLLVEAKTRLVKRSLPTKAEALAQDEALALLLASARAHEPAAAEALASVVRDGSIEDAKLDLPIRRQLAGLKAEAMHSWSAANAEAHERMPALLPGPVSRKIWANVLERQASNRAEGGLGGVTSGEDQ